MVPSVRSFQTTGTLSTDWQPRERISSWSKKTARMSSAVRPTYGRRSRKSRSVHAEGVTGLRPPTG